MTYGITGASGKLGRLTADALLAQVDAADVVLITREPARLADYAQRGVDVRAGDFSDPATLAAAFAGVDRLLLISTDAVGARVEQQKTAIDEAIAAGVKRIAYTSIPNPSDSNPAFVVPDHRATEQHLIASGVAYTFLRNAIYSDMLALSAPGAIASGTLLSNFAGGLTDNVARADCAAVAAAVLVGDEHDNKTYDITGPEAVDAAALAALYSELSGKPVAVVEVDDAAWVAAMVEHAGMPEAMAQAFATFGISQRQGYAAIVSTAVQDLTGRPARTIREVLAPLLSA